MGDKTKIEWTDATWNPVRGCSVVSEGCRNCYAMQVAARFSGEGQAYEGLAYRNSSGAHWAGKVRLVEEHLEDPLRWKRPRRIFVNSMSDLFHESLDEVDIGQVFGVMALAKQHTFQVLTKRPARMLAILETARICFDFDEPLPNVWLGVSVEDQKTADERIPLLMKVPAAVRWISAEPLLGPMNLDGFLTYEYPHCAGFRGGHVEEGYCTNCHGHITDPIHTQSPAKLDWIVAGGESGPGARPMHPDWARSLRDQCATAGVPFYFKQWGEWDGGLNAIPQDCQTPCGRCVMALRTWNGNEWRGEKLTDTNWTPGVQPGALQIHRVGKKAAGHLLDGREHREFPNAS